MRGTFVQTGGYWTVCLAGFNALVAIAAFLLELDFSWMRWIAAFSFAILGILIWEKRVNILFLARTVFLGGIGYFPMAVKAVAGPDILFSGYEVTTQGFEIVVIMYVATSIAILGNEIGLRLGCPSVGSVALR